MRATLPFVKYWSMLNRNSMLLTVSTKVFSAVNEYYLAMILSSLLLLLLLLGTHNFTLSTVQCRRCTVRSTAHFTLLLSILLCISSRVHFVALWSQAQNTEQHSTHKYPAKQFQSKWERRSSLVDDSLRFEFTCRGASCVRIGRCLWW